jgi:hypothetical protein
MSSDVEMDDSSQSGTEIEPVVAIAPDIPTLCLYASDTLAIPAMSAECERVFSSTKKLITPERNRLTEEIIEASECLKNWWERGLIQQLQHADSDF